MSDTLKNHCSNINLLMGICMLNAKQKYLCGKVWHLASLNNATSYIHTNTGNVVN